MLTTAGGLMSQVIAAHELGHAYHFEAMGQTRFWRRKSPMPLMETASNVAEHLFRRGVAIQATRADQRLAVRASSLDAAVNYLLRTPRDFEVELSLYELRERGPFDPAALKALCRTMHQRWFSDAFAPDGDEFSWTTMLAFPADSVFFNFPYTFGYALSLRIADHLQSGGDAALERYLEFLRSTGSLPVEECVAQIFGFDVTSAAFWNETVDKIAEEVEAFGTVLASAGRKAS
jgi:oligoendopeptidase F